MRVVVLPMDDSACGSYRCIWPASKIKDQMGEDWQIEIYRPGSIKIAPDRNGRLAAVFGLELEGIDVLVTQRLGTPRMLEFMRLVQSKGTAVVLDADDALWCIHRENSAYKAWNGEQCHWSWMDQAAKEADLVTVTTDRLARRYGSHGRVEIIPNRVPAGVSELFNPKANSKETQIGWAGWVGTHPVDLQVVGDSVARVLGEYESTRVTIVGNGQGILGAWQLQDYREKAVATGPLPIDDYFPALTRLDIGLVPLEESVFNSCKSSLKAAEYSAVGVPSIVSPTPANRELLKEGYPVLFAQTPADWHRYLEVLVIEEDLRLSLSHQAYAAGLKHSMDNHLEDWVKAWTRAVSRRRAVARR